MGTTLITGADGYLGRRVAAGLLAAGDDRLVLAVRAADAAELAAKRDRLVTALGQTALGQTALGQTALGQTALGQTALGQTALDPAAGLGPAAGARVEVVAADLREDGALSAVDPAAITRIVHAAAVTRFNVERDEAQASNVDGTVRLAGFARRCANLTRLAFLSTLYTAGRHQGEIPERRHADLGFVNHYEWSKWTAEEHLLDADLPVSVLRLPTVIADDDTGQVVQYNAFHNTLKLFFYGLLSLVPGQPGTPLSLATAGFTTAAVVHLLDPAAPAGIYQVCPDPAGTPTLGGLLDTALDVFERDAGYRRRQLLRPAYCDQDSFDDLVSAASRFRGGPIQESLASVAPFGTQLYLPKRFGNEKLRAAWPGYAAPDAGELVERVCEYLVASRWGRQPVTRSREARLSEVAG
jgi:nucleoside-diphosphate-sugar epimerase